MSNPAASFTHPLSRGEIEEYLTYRKEVVSTMNPNHMFFYPDDTQFVYLRDGDFSHLPFGWKYIDGIRYYDFEGNKLEAPDDTRREE